LLLLTVRDGDARRNGADDRNRIINNINGNSALIPTNIPTLIQIPYFPLDFNGNFSTNKSSINKTYNHRVQL